MHSRNYLELIGNLGQDPELRHTDDNAPYCRLAQLARAAVRGVAEHNAAERRRRARDESCRAPARAGALVRAQTPPPEAGLIDGSPSVGTDSTVAVSLVLRTSGPARHTPSTAAP